MKTTLTPQNELFIKPVQEKEDTIATNEEFWTWFQQNADVFFSVVKSKVNIERDFFAHLSKKLNELRSDYFYLTGMANDDTVELILTVDGEIKNIAFVEALVDAAPKIDGWIFTALKPALDIKNVNIRMADYIFGADNLNFYANEHSDFPDEIDITIIHDDLNDANRETITNGTFIFLDNFLGELNFVTMVDATNIIGKAEAAKALVPIARLKDFLIWREKEFIEKYEGIRHNTENDEYSVLQATLANGLPLTAIVNRALLQWDSKASHPWILVVEIKYDGIKTNGLPDNEVSALMAQMEEDIMLDLNDRDGYLNIGHETSDGTREIYFACKDFRKPSKIADQFQRQYAGKLVISYEIYKDKYWRSFDRFE